MLDRMRRWCRGIAPLRDKELVRRGGVLSAAMRRLSGRSADHLQNRRAAIGGLLIGERRVRGSTARGYRLEDRRFAEQRGLRRQLADLRDVSLCLFGQRAATLQMIFQPSRSAIVCREEVWDAEQLDHLTHIRGAGDDVVV